MSTLLGALVLFCEEGRENVVDGAKSKTTAFCEEEGLTEERLQIIDILYVEMRNRTSHIDSVIDELMVFKTRKSSKR